VTLYLGKKNSCSKYMSSKIYHFNSLNIYIIGTKSSYPSFTATGTCRVRDCSSSYMEMISSSLLLLFFIMPSFVCMDVLHVYVSVPHACLMLTEARGRCWIPWNSPSPTSRSLFKRFQWRDSGGSHLFSQHSGGRGRPISSSKLEASRFQDSQGYQEKKSFQ